jgi:hypothetical protein
LANMYQFKGFALSLVSEIKILVSFQSLSVWQR